MTDPTNSNPTDPAHHTDSNKTIKMQFKNTNIHFENGHVESCEVTAAVAPYLPDVVLMLKHSADMG